MPAGRRNRARRQMAPPGQLRHRPHGRDAREPAQPARRLRGDDAEPGRRTGVPDRPVGGHLRHRTGGPRRPRPVPEPRPGGRNGRRRTDESSCRTRRSSTGSSSGPPAAPFETSLDVIVAGERDPEALAIAINCRNRMDAEAICVGWEKSNAMLQREADSQIRGLADGDEDHRDIGRRGAAALDGAIYRHVTVDSDQGLTVIETPHPERTAATAGDSAPRDRRGVRGQRTRRLLPPERHGRRTNARRGAGSQRSPRSRAALANGPDGPDPPGTRLTSAPDKLTSAPARAGNGQVLRSWLTEHTTGHIAQAFGWVFL